MPLSIQRQLDRLSHSRLPSGVAQIRPAPPSGLKSATPVLPVLPLTPSPPEPELRVGRRATSAGTTAYLTQLFLDLPFPAQGPVSQNSNPNCSSSQPDVLQVNHDNASVNRITTCPMQFVTTIPVAGHPLQIAITPDGTTALVTSFDNAINFINLASNTVTFSMPTPSIHPNGIAITSDGSAAYVTHFVPSNASLVKIDLASHSIVASMPVGTYPQSVFLSPDGAQLYVTYPYLNLVSIVDTLTFTEAYRFAVQAPRGIAFNSTGTKAYIASAGNPDNATSGTVLEFDTSRLQVTNTYNVGLGPNDVAVLYSDQYVITTNYEGQSVSEINILTGTVQTVSTGGQVSGLSIVQ